LISRKLLATVERVGERLWGIVLVCLLSSRVAVADDVAEAKLHYKRATSAYALGDYQSAAREYEEAFKLEPDSALLYNAAQAHRMAGNIQRALDLYTSYLRLPGPISNRGEVDRHIANLKIAVEQQRKAASTPPLTTEPMKVTPAPPPPVPQPPPAKQAEPPVEKSAAPPPTVAKVSAPPAASPPAPVTFTVATKSPRPWWKKGWVWGVVAGVAVAGIAVGLGAGLGARPVDPAASLGGVTF
jgi:tetratricopeptide (TPR) repeat protein